MLLPVSLAWTILAGALTPPPPFDSEEATVATWVEKYLDTKDWTELSWTDDRVRFTSGAGMNRTAQDRVRLWVREEMFAPEQTEDGPYRSLMVLTEYDCTEGRYRMLAADAFPYNNLGGESWTYDEQAAEWAYARPATIAEYEIGVVCGWMAEADATDETATGVWREGGQ